MFISSLHLHTEATAEPDYPFLLCSAVNVVAFLSGLCRRGELELLTSPLINICGREKKEMFTSLLLESLLLEGPHFIWRSQHSYFTEVGQTYRNTTQDDEAWAFPSSYLRCQATSRSEGSLFFLFFFYYFLRHGHSRTSRRPAGKMRLRRWTTEAEDFRAQTLRSDTERREVLEYPE